MDIAAKRTIYIENERATLRQAQRSIRENIELVTVAMSFSQLNMAADFAPVIAQQTYDAEASPCRYMVLFFDYSGIPCWLLVDELREAVTIWAAERSMLPRAACLVLMAWLAFPLIADPEATGWFSAINLVIHETGHLVLRLTGIKFIEILGGTLAQLVVPLFMAVSFLQQGDLFVPSFAGFWLGTNLANISVYMADARAQALPLVSVGVEGVVPVRLIRNCSAFLRI